MKGKPITVRPDAGLRQRMEALATAEDRSMTWIVEKCVAGHLAVLEERYHAQTHVEKLNHVPAKPVVYKIKRRKNT